MDPDDEAQSFRNLFTIRTVIFAILLVLAVAAAFERPTVSRKGQKGIGKDLQKETSILRITDADRLRIKLIVYNSILQRTLAPGESDKLFAATEREIRALEKNGVSFAGLRGIPRAAIYHYWGREPPASFEAGIPPGDRSQPSAVLIRAASRQQSTG